MDDGRLDMLEKQLLRHAKTRTQPQLPADFTAGVMRAVRAKAERRLRFLDVFGVAAWRFVPAGALAATAMYGYALQADKVLGQALLSISLSGGGSLTTLAALMP